MRLIVTARESAQVGETGEGHRGDAQVACAGQADVGPAQLQPAPRECQGMVAARAGCGDAERRPAERPAKTFSAMELQSCPRGVAAPTRVINTAGASVMGAPRGGWARDLR